MEIKLTESEIKTLKFYLEKALIDAEGMRAIGIGSARTTINLKSIMHKISR